MEGFEDNAVIVISWVRLAIELFGAGIVATGVVRAIVHGVRARYFAGEPGETKPGETGWRAGFRSTRLILSQYLALALEFQLAADILATTVAPDWSQIGKLGAVAAIRTFLNYFLEREVRDMEARGEPPPEPPMGLGARRVDRQP